MRIDVNKTVKLSEIFRGIEMTSEETDALCGAMWRGYKRSESAHGHDAITRESAVMWIELAQCL
jgi:hypothetical protein